MCGIIGVVQKNEKALGEKMGIIIRDSLKRLEYRGYDSVGYAIIDRNGRLVIRKAKGKIDDLLKRLEFERFDGLVGVGHTRWATHGPPSDLNAHPHTDCSRCIAIVHNGVIRNYQELRDELASRGHMISSDTDTELIAHLIEDYLREGFEMIDALRMIMRKIDGSYAFLVISCRETDKIYFAKKISPLIIGLGEGFNLISSDIPGLIKYSRKIIAIEDGELGYISPEKIYIENIYGERIDPLSRVKIIDWTIEQIERGGYPHYMLKEIYEQSIAVRNTLASVAEQIRDVINILLSDRDIFITGAGTSYHAALVMDYALKYYLGTRSTAFISSEISLYKKIFDKKSVLIAISQSGETIDTLNALRTAKERGALIISLTNSVDSAISRESHYKLYIRAGPEIGVAATKTFTSQVTFLLYLVSELLREQDPDAGSLIKKELEESPELIDRYIKKIDKESESLASILKDSRNIYVLGRDISLPVSMEGALKIKEISYVHAEAYPAGESKHGPIALVEKDFPVAFTSLGFEHNHVMVSNIEEMKARGAFIIAVAPYSDERIHRLADYSFLMPSMKTVAASILYVIPYQLLAYHLAVKRGFDPDKPRNLAKTVTVE